jgi:peptidoglycan/LPS O-acetylase OafA/YrhL
LTPVGLLAGLSAQFRRWYELPDEGVRVPTMAGIRGLSVLLVFAVHVDSNLSFLLTEGTWKQRLSFAVGQVGHGGVDVFFLLSGYLIYASTLKPSFSLGRFWLRRVERIYPPFLATLVIYVALSALVPELSKFPAALWDKVLLMAANLVLLPGLLPFTPIITVAWSLSFEACFYLSIPFIVIATGMRRWTSPQRVLFFVGLATLFSVLFVSGPLYRPGYWTPARLLMFIGGIILYERLGITSRVRPLAASRWRDVLVGVVFGGALVAHYWIWVQTTHEQPAFQTALWLLAKVVTIAIGSAVMCAHCFRRRGVLHDFFEWAPLRWLGNMSYSYFLIHALAIHAVAQVAQRTRPEGYTSSLAFTIAVLVAFGLSLVVATVLFLFVERPLSLERKPRRVPQNSV